MPLNLNWGKYVSTDTFVNINPKRRVYCKLGWISGDENRDKLIFSLQSYPYGQRHCVEKGKWKFRVSVFAENVQKKFSKEFVINWSGKWMDSEKGMFREIVISPV